VPAVHADCHFLGYSPVDGKLYTGNDGGVYSTNDEGLVWTDHTAGMTIGQIYKLGQAQTVKNKVINGFQDNGTYTLSPSEWVATGGGDGMECAVDYLNAAYTYHTIYYGRIYRRYNNGAEKEIAGQGIFGIDEKGAWITPFILSRPDPKVMFVGYKNIWRCNDVKTGVLTWNKISDRLAGTNTSDLSVLEQSPANTDILYAVRYDNKLFRTDNCMDNNPAWDDLSPYLPASGTPTDLAGSPVDENVVYMTLAKKVYKSNDKGRTWTNISGSLPNVNLNTIACYKNAREGLYVGSDAGIYYKDSSMSDWISFSQGLPANGRVTEVEIYYNNDTISEDAIRASTYGRGLWGSDMYHGLPVADFSSSKTEIPITCGIDFYDLSSGVPTNFEWNFTGGNPSASTLKNPTNIVYNTIGTYPVTLKAWNTNGTDSITKTGYIVVNNTMKPDVNFTADQNVLCEESKVHFTDKTENCPSSWSWQFNPNTVTYLDGTSENSQNPVVQFNDPVIYHVTLTAYNAVGSGTLAKYSYIANGGWGLPIEENFALGFEYLHWTISNPDLSVTWDTITVAGVSDGSKAAWMNFFNYSGVNKRDQLISPAMDFSGYSSVTLSFRHSYAQRASLRDSLIIRISTDCGNTWTRVWGIGPDGTPNTFVTHEPSMEEFYPASTNDWCGGSYGVSCYNIDLSPWAGNSNIKVLFESYNRNGNNLFINDISIAGPVGVKEQTTDALRVSLYPNPSTGKVALTINDLKENCGLIIFDIQGQQVSSDQFTTENGVTTRQLDLGSLAKGIYYLRLTTVKATLVEKIILQ
ncbi:MAG: T9SS type A sorting domain-containing protein, partial [bacterium]